MRCIDELKARQTALYVFFRLENMPCHESSIPIVAVPIVATCHSGTVSRSKRASLSRNSRATTTSLPAMLSVNRWKRGAVLSRPTRNREAHMANGMNASPKAIFQARKPGMKADSVYRLTPNKPLKSTMTKGTHHSIWPVRKAHLNTRRQFWFAQSVVAGPAPTGRNPVFAGPRLAGCPEPA